MGGSNLYQETSKRRSIPPPRYVLSEPANVCYTRWEHTFEEHRRSSHSTTDTSWKEGGDLTGHIRFVICPICWSFCTACREFLHLQQSCWSWPCGSYLWNWYFPATSVSHHFFTELLHFKESHARIGELSLLSCYIHVKIRAHFETFLTIYTQLEPYFSRIKFTREEKKHWFHDREGLLFGFALGFYIFLRIPLLGVLIYGIAEASTAYLITKITDPPPSPAHSEGFAASQQQWRNKHEFLNLKLSSLDALNISAQNHLAPNPITTETSPSTATSSAVPSEPPPPYSEYRGRQ